MSGPASLRGAGWPSWRTASVITGATTDGLAVESGTWTAAGGAITEYAYGGVAVTRFVGTGTLQFSVEVRFPAGRAVTTQRGGVFLGTGAVQLYLPGNLVVTNDVGTTLVDLGAGWADGQWIKLEVRTIGDDLTVWVDEEWAITTSQGSPSSGLEVASLAAGGVGLSSAGTAGDVGNGVDFRRFSVSEAEWRWPT